MNRFLLWRGFLFGVLLAFPVPDAARAAATPYQLNPKETHDLRLTPKPDGSLDIETTGTDPWLAFAPQGAADAKAQGVFVFEYFCPEGISNFSVFYGEPWAEQRALRGLSLPKAEGWQPFRVNIDKLSLGKFGTGGTGVRLGLGIDARVRIQLRNLRVETANAEDLKSAEQVRAERDRRLARDKAVTDYLHADYPFNDATARLDGDNIRFLARRTDPHRFAREVALAQFPIWASPWQLMLASPPEPGACGLCIERPVAIDSGDDAQWISVAIPRFVQGRDRFPSRWALVEKSGASYRLASPAVYIEDHTLPAKFPSEPITVSTKKGMGGVHENVDELAELGVGSVTINLTPMSFFRLEPAPGRQPFRYQDHTYYFDEEGLAKYDAIVKQCADHQIKVALIILIQKEGPEGLDKILPHPDCTKSGVYAMPNMTTEAATDAYGAVLAFLGERWGARHGAHGYAPYWILHNEVDYGWTWTNMGEAPPGVYMDTYARSMRLCSLLARQYNPDARVFITLTHSWEVAPDPKMRTYAPKAMLETLAAFSKREGDFDWGVAYHPYPQSLFEAATWNDKNATFSYATRFITPKNIEVLDAFMHEPFMRYHGDKLRPVILSEQGFHTRDYSEKQQRLQAAAFVYTFHKIRPLASIEGFQNHRWVDSAGEGGLMVGIRKLPDAQHPEGEKKLAWDIYQAIDTPAEAEKTQFAKEVIGVADFSDIPYRGPIEGASTGQVRFP